LGAFLPGDYRLLKSEAQPLNALEITDAAMEQGWLESKRASLSDLFRMNGIFVIDKPEGMTSHDVVQAIRKKFNISKAGHFGTLDPMATGVLPVAVGKATRFGQFIPNSPKEYEGEIRFGFATNTYDREGVPTTDERPLQGDVNQAMRGLTGLLDQTPPPFSAKKIGGVPAYKLARKDRPVEVAAAQVEVREFVMLELHPPLMRFRVVCSPGTYIRSLAHDLGRRLGCGAHLTALRRTRSGEFRIEDAVLLDRVSAADLVPMDRLLEYAPRIVVSDAEETRVLHGNPVRGEGSGKELHDASDDGRVGTCQPLSGQAFCSSATRRKLRSQVVRIFNKKGEFLAVASVENGLVLPRLVLTSITSHEGDMLGCNLEKENQS
jgi:tRNA pseudouridine55 synthase